MRMNVVVAGPLDPCHPYLSRMVAALGRLGYAVAVTELESSDQHAAAAARLRETTGAPEPLVIDGSALPACVHMADRLAAGRAILFIRETWPADDLATMLRHAGRVVVTSEPARQRLCAEHPFAAERIRVIEPGIATGLPRSDGPAHSARCAILALDPVWPRPDHPLLFRALARLTDLDWSLTIAVASAGAALAAQANEHGLADRLRLADAAGGAVPDQSWQDAGLCVFATDSDGDGLAMSEALRRGVPVAVAGGQGMTGRIPCTAGATVAAGDLAGLSNAMRRLIFDARLRREMGEAAWELGRALPAWDVQARRFATVLEE